MKEVKFGNKWLSFILNSEADKSVFYEIFEAREYGILDEIIKNAKNPILDLGAHIGLFSLYASALNSTVEILAFEPEERNFQILKENFRLNKIQNVLAKNLAVASNEGEIGFNLSEDSHNHSLIELENSVAKKKVQATTLEKIFLKNRIEKCSLVKMDIEGAEFDILQVLSPEIFKKIQNIYIEYHEYTSNMNPQRLIQILQKNNFKTQLKKSSYDKRFGFIFARAMLR